MSSIDWGIGVMKIELANEEAPRIHLGGEIKERGVDRVFRPNT